MSNQRSARVSDQMREELSMLIRELKDPRVGFVSIVRVEVSGDLRHAKVYTSVMGTPQEQKESMKVLTRAGGFLRTELSRVMSLRSVPELHFHFDESITQGARIAQLLVQVQQDQKEQEAQANQEDKGED